MPRFSKSEKEILRQKLFEEGERLFTLFGIKKVSIEELAQSVGIAKGSFYSFFPGKEHLFMEIVITQQEKMWDEMEEFLLAHQGVPPRQLFKQTFLWMIEQFERYPLIQKMDTETTEYLFRKLPKEMIESHTNDDSQELLKLEKYGIRFTCDITVASKTMQTLALNFFALTKEDENVRLAVLDIMLDGIIEKIVAEGFDTIGNDIKYSPSGGCARFR